MKTITITVASLLFACTWCNAQFEDVAYLDDVLESCKKKEATFVKKLVAQEGEAYECHVESVNGDMRMIGFFQDKALTIEHGEFTYFYPNGKVESKGRYEYGQKTGVWKRFDSSGNPKADKIYDATALKEITYSIVSEQPIFNQDYTSLSEYIRSSVQNNGKKVKGSIQADFVVKKDGSVTDIYLVEGIDASVDAEIKNALRNMPTWTPGRNKGQVVRVAMKLDMKF